MRKEVCVCVAGAISLLGGCGGSPDATNQGRSAPSAKAVITAARTFEKPSPTGYPANFCEVVLVKDPTRPATLKSLSQQVAKSEQFCRGAIATTHGLRGAGIKNLNVRVRHITRHRADAAVTYTQSGAPQHRGLHLAELGPGGWRVITSVGG